MKAVSSKLNIMDTEAKHHFKCKRTISLLPEVLVAGRAVLPRKKAQCATVTKVENTEFCFTQSFSCLLERIAGCVAQKEPVLLVGETGTGKTSAIQYLADSIGHKLIVINMNQQSESTDFLGGYKPVDLKFLISPIREEFELLFRSFFNVKAHETYLKDIAMRHNQQDWKRLVRLMRYSTNAAVKKLRDRCKNLEEDSKQAEKKLQKNLNDLNNWTKMLDKLNKLRTVIKKRYTLAFSFIEGSLVKALREGHWILFDEINLANAETLECLSGLLENSSDSLALLERSDEEPVKRHPDFTIFACMNPATDVGKRNLPVGLRNRFTEFYVNDVNGFKDLFDITSSYLKNLDLPVQRHKAITRFYMNVRDKAVDTLCDGTGHKPHYSLRTFCRALRISASNPCNNVLRSLYEAFSLSFLTQLDHKSYPIVEEIIADAILKDKDVLKYPIPQPSGFGEYIQVEGYWVLKGSLKCKEPTNVRTKQNINFIPERALIL